MPDDLPEGNGFKLKSPSSYDELFRNEIARNKWTSGLVVRSLGVLVDQGTTWVTAGQIVVIGIEASPLNSS